MSLRNIAALAVLCLSCASGHELVAGPDAHRMVDAGALLLDVRTPGEYARDHLPGAVNVPLQELPRRLAELGSHERAVVVYCQSGGRSSKAATLLREAGFTDVQDLGEMARYSSP